MEQATDKSNKTFNCLIVDDSEFAQKNIAKIVFKMGGDVIGQAKNGIDAVDLYFRLKPDLVLLDITLPELDGIETLKSIIDKDKNAKVIIISSIGHKEMICKAIDLGAKHYITKPFEASYVEMIINSVIEKEDGF